jgi:hypothetical protein
MRRTPHRCANARISSSVPNPIARGRVRLTQKCVSGLGVANPEFDPLTACDPLHVVQLRRETRHLVLSLVNLVATRYCPDLFENSVGCAGGPSSAIGGSTAEVAGSRRRHEQADDREIGDSDEHTRPG